MSLIIGISGKKQSGKSSLASYLGNFFNLKLNGVQFDKSRLIQSEETCEVSYRRDNGSIVSMGEMFHRQFQETLVMTQNYVKTYSFADPIKDFCINVLGMTHAQVHGTDEEKNSFTPYLWEKFRGYAPVISYKEEIYSPSEYIVDTIKTPQYKTGPMTAREVMQILGTEIMRNHFGDDIWVKATMRKIASENPAVAFIADVRFHSEVSSLVENNGHLIRLDRSVFAEDRHPSEIALDNYDWDSVPRLLRINNSSMDEKNSIALEWAEKLLCLI